MPPFEAPADLKLVFQQHFPADPRTTAWVTTEHMGVTVQARCEDTRSHLTYYYMTDKWVLTFLYNRDPYATLPFRSWIEGDRDDFERTATLLKVALL
jgi:hypothetical protein